MDNLKNKTELPQSLLEFIKDKDGTYSEAQLLSVIRRLQKEGQKNRKIFKALRNVLFQFVSEMEPIDQFYLLESLHEDISIKIYSMNWAIDILKEDMENHPANFDN